MLKVYLSGFPKPVSVVGNFSYEDERYMVLDDNSIKRKIPLDRIVFIEDLSVVVPTQQPVQGLFASKQIGSNPTMAEPMSSEKLQTVLKDGLLKHGANISDLAPRIDQHTDVTIIVSGAADESFSIKMTTAAISAGQFTPMVAKELALDNNFKRIMSNGIIFKGLPKVVGNTIHVETTRLEEKVEKLTEGLNDLAKLSSVSKFKKPEKVYRNDFSLFGAQAEFGDSPFESAIPLSDNDDGQVINDSSVQETSNH
jgi:hypothetical protein